MPFIANTPESLLARTDSKKPDSTCHGVTSNGRPCRRPIAARTPTRVKLAVPDDPSDESLYCWQHKEQASTRSSPQRRPSQAIPEERSSLDTLADRLGLVDLNSRDKTQRNENSAGEKRHRSRRTKRSKENKPTTMRFCFCFSIPVEDDATPPRPHRPRPQPRPVQRHDTQQQPSAPVPSTQHSKQQQQQQHLPDPAASSPPGKHSHRSAKSNASSTTAARLKSFIPDSLDVPTASALMSELARPLAGSDEPGYIYMFWLTPVSASAPVPVDAARSLLAPPPPSGSAQQHPSRGASDDAVSNFAAGAAGSSSSKKTMLLKIGRAANVQRRMNQWHRQCGYSIQMLRYYPYIPSSSSSSPSSLDPNATPRMTPHCKKVERLVHLELSGMGLRAKLGTCEACGREHREWFEVEASREGIRSVDEVIRRWIEWDDANA